MTTEEKLEHFSQDAMGIANRKHSEELAEYEKNLNNLFESHKRTSRRQAVARLRLTREGNLRERNRRLSKQRMEAKYAISTAEMELKDKLFEQVNDMINAYRKKPEYLNDLVLLVNDARKQLGTDKLYIFIDKSDEALLQGLEQKTGLTVQTADEPLVGGIMAMPEGGNILVDLSYAKILDSSYDNLKLGGEE